MQEYITGEVCLATALKKTSGGKNQEKVRVRVRVRGDGDGNGDGDGLYKAAPSLPTHPTPTRLHTPPPRPPNSPHDDPPRLCLCLRLRVGPDGGHQVEGDQAHDTRSRQRRPRLL